MAYEFNDNTGRGGGNKMKTENLLVPTRRSKNPPIRSNLNFTRTKQTKLSALNNEEKELKILFKAATHCAYCGRAFDAKTRKTKDHVFPLAFRKLFPKTFEALGGAGYKNIVAACKRCNNLRATFGHSTERLMEFLGKKLENFHCDEAKYNEAFASFSFCKKSMGTLLHKTKNFDPKNLDECERIFLKFLHNASSITITQQERLFLMEQRIKVDRLVYEMASRKKKGNEKSMNEDVSLIKDNLKKFELVMKQDHLYSLIVKAQLFSPQDVPAMLDVFKTFVLTGKISDPNLVENLDKYK
jgi:5-methylcytosine-specific restriction endonuclease McrA